MSLNRLAIIFIVLTNNEIVYNNPIINHYNPTPARSVLSTPLFVVIERNGSYIIAKKKKKKMKHQRRGCCYYLFICFNSIEKSEA